MEGAGATSYCTAWLSEQQKKDEKTVSDVGEKGDEASRGVLIMLLTRPPTDTPLLITTAAQHKSDELATRNKRGDCGVTLDEGSRRRHGLALEHHTEQNTDTVVRTIILQPACPTHGLLESLRV